jgi:hypothetical protein
MSIATGLVSYPECWRPGGFEASGKGKNQSDGTILEI